MRAGAADSPYTPDDVWRLRGSLAISYSLASYGARRCGTVDGRGLYRSALGVTGNQAVQAVRAAAAIYVSAGSRGRRNEAARRTRTESLSSDSVRRCCGAPAPLRRADEIHHMKGETGIAVRAARADAEAGFGGAAARIRTNERHDRGGAAACTSRISSPRQEVRPSGRQGARATSEFVAKLRRRAPGRRLRVDTLLIAPPMRTARRCSRATATSTTAAS